MPTRSGSPASRRVAGATAVATSSLLRRPEYPMTHTVRTWRRQLWLQALESRIAPVTDFQITSLTANNSAVVQHDAVTGDDFGGIAVSGSQAFVTGATATARFALSNLS